MEGNWKRAQPEASMGSSMDVAATSCDWRSQLQPEARQRIVNKIMETLKRHLPISVPEGLNELRKIAIRFEEKIYTAATSQSDYLRKISMKMLSMGTKTQQTSPINPAMPNTGAVNQNPADPDMGFYYQIEGSLGMQSQVNNPGQLLAIPNRQSLLSQNLQNNTSAAVPGSSGLGHALPSTAGLGQSNISGVSQASNLQNISGISQSSVNNSMAQGAQPDIYANPQRQMQGRKLSEPVPEKGSTGAPTFSRHICMDGSEKRQEPIFSCPICMCTLASPFSTICGHIFCEVCIVAAIKRRKDCPTCRTKLRGRNNIHRVYLPTAD